MKPTKKDVYEVDTESYSSSSDEKEEELKIRCQKCDKAFHEENILKNVCTSVSTHKILLFCLWCTPICDDCEDQLCAICCDDIYCSDCELKNRKDKVDYVCQTDFCMNLPAKENCVHCRGLFCSENHSHQGFCSVHDHRVCHDCVQICTRCEFKFICLFCKPVDHVCSLCKMKKRRRLNSAISLMSDGISSHLRKRLKIS